MMTYTFRHTFKIMADLRSVKGANENIYWCFIKPPDHKSQNLKFWVPFTLVKCCFGSSPIPLQKNKYKLK